MGAREKKRKHIEVYIGFAVSLICIWWLAKYVEEGEIVEKLKSANPFWICGAIISTIVSYFIRSYRWPLFFPAKKPAFYDSYKCLIVGFFMNNVLPARIGEIVRAHIGGRATGNSRMLVLATIAAERLADGVMISLIFACCFTFGATQAEIENSKNVFYVAYLFAAAGVGTILVLITREAIFSLVERLLVLFPIRALKFSVEKARIFIDGLEPMFKWQGFLPVSILSLLVWFVELSVYYQVSLAFHQQMSLAGLSLFLAVVNFSSLIPAAPAGIGVIEAATTISLVKLGLGREVSLAMVAVQHLIQIAVVGVPGAYFFYSTLGGKIPSAEDEPQTLA